MLSRATIPKWNLSLCGTLRLSLLVVSCPSTIRHPDIGRICGVASQRCCQNDKRKGEHQPPKKLCAAPAPRSDRASASRKRWFARPKTRTLSHLKASVATPLSPASHQPTNDVMVFTTDHSECDATMDPSTRFTSSCLYQNRGNVASSLNKNSYDMPIYLL